jgi:hypothetical protein
MPKPEFSVDLDFFAPLGNGNGNAAIWFRDFGTDDGARTAELKEARRVRADLLGQEVRVLAPDDPILREAQAWVDQAKCRFYPDVWKSSGHRIDMPIPPLAFAIELSRSWTARGLHETDLRRAKEDFRRAIRLGRLFMQDDLSLIQQLGGWSCVAYGLQGLNHAAHEEGDAVMVAATTQALGDFNSMRYISAQWTTSMSLKDALRKRPWGWSVAFEDAAVDRVISAASDTPLRAMRVEALYQLVLMEHEGTREQKEKATAALTGAERDKDEDLARVARWLRKEPYDLSFYTAGLK